jgi:hypothetical protein
MRKWHWYIRNDGSAYWSEHAHATGESYIAWIMADEKPSGPPWNKTNQNRSTNAPDALPTLGQSPATD